MAKTTPNPRPRNFPKDEGLPENLIPFYNEQMRNPKSTTNTSPPAKRKKLTDTMLRIIQQRRDVI